jgi:glutathione synthase/RimK-type ligase-like ATP-grasp enzyme
VNSVHILLISDSKDYTTDFISVELERRKQAYLRMDKDKFPECKLCIDLDKAVLTIEKKSMVYRVSAKILKSVFYRAPTYLRETFSRATTPAEQLTSSQWMAFIRNLTMFEKATWVNNPIFNYKAENKLLQLFYARNIGFRIPITKILNYYDQWADPNGQIIVKSLDTALFRVGEQEGFVYSTVMNANDLQNYDLSIAPVVLQEYLYPKIDLRVTVIGKKVYAVKITKNNKGVDGDWRKLKNEVDFIPINLPPRISRACIELIRAFGLNFGAIDLVESKGDYFFIEVNPTGEWAWLVNSANLPIHEGICDFLMG